MTARLERQKLHNQHLVDRRRKVEEDENSFQAHEEARKQADASKRFVERKKKVEQERGRKELEYASHLVLCPLNRALADCAVRTYSDEREKNRQRKLSAVNNREWDSTKTEEDYNPKKQSSRFRRGVYGATTTPPRDAPTGPRRIAVASGGSPSKNPTSTQEWPDLPPTAKGTLSAKSAPSVGGHIAGDASLTNGQQAAGDGPTDKNESKAQNKASEEQRLGAVDHGGDTLAPLSPAVGGGSWAEQVEANT